MALENKLGITDSAELHRAEERRISFGNRAKSPIWDVEIKRLLWAAMTDKINDRELYMKGIDRSYYYEGYSAFRAEDL